MWCAFQTRCTIDLSIPKCLASDRVLQCVASLGVVSSVTRTIVLAQCRRLPALRPRPDRSRSMPSSRSCAKRLRQQPTVSTFKPSVMAIRVLGSPWAANRINLARTTCRAANVRDRAQRLNSCRSASVNVIETAFRIAGILHQYIRCRKQNIVGIFMRHYTRLGCQDVQQRKGNSTLEQGRAGKANRMLEKLVKGTAIERLDGYHAV